MTLWSGRFDAAPDPAAFEFGISFGFDRRLFEDDVIGSIAWAEALGDAGVLSVADVAAIVAGVHGRSRLDCRASRHLAQGLAAETAGRSGLAVGRPAIPRHQGQEEFVPLRLVGLR